MAQEQRKNPRIDFHLDVSVKGKKGEQAVRNLTLYGVFLKTGETGHYKIGDEISVVMRLPNERNNMEVRGRVAHVSDKGIGVEFLDMLASDAIAMECCFHVFKHTTPLPET